MPEDVEALRYVVRVNESGRGFLFLNNYQDHVEMVDQKDFAVEVNTDMGRVRIPESGSLNLEKGGFAILPIWFSFGEVPLKYSSAQMVTRVRRPEAEYYFFTCVPGMRPEYVFEDVSVFEDVENCEIDGQKILARENKISTFSFTDKKGVKYVITTLPEEEGLRLWQIEEPGEKKLVLSDCPVFLKDGKIEMEYTAGKENSLSIFPGDRKALLADGRPLECTGREAVFEVYAPYYEEKKFQIEIEDRSTVNDKDEQKLKRPVVGSPVSSTKVVNARAVLRFTPEDFAGLKRLLLKVDYEGDVGYAFINGEMIHDNFCNGTAWEIDLLPYQDELIRHGMYIYISPKKKGAYVDNSSAMAARFEVVEEQIAKIYGIRFEGIKKVGISAK